jgi:hypothetical protein
MKRKTKTNMKTDLDLESFDAFTNSDIHWMRLLAQDIRRFTALYADEIPNHLVGTMATANMIDVIADRLERRAR